MLSILNITHFTCCRDTAIFQNILLEQGKQFFLHMNRALLEHLPGYQDCLNAQDLQAWIDHSYAMAGCESRDHYYEVYNPVNYVYKAARPILSINSEDGESACH